MDEKWKWKSQSRVWLFGTPWNSSRQEFFNTGVGNYPFSSGSSQPRDQTQVSWIAGGFFNSWATREAQSYTTEYYSAIKKKWNNTNCSNMDEPRDYYIKSERKKTNTIPYHLYVESKIQHKWTELHNRNRPTHRCREKAYGCQEGVKVAETNTTLKSNYPK